jgi:hypothetical protein
MTLILCILAYRRTASLKIAVLLLSNIRVILAKTHSLILHKITVGIHNSHILTITFSGPPFGFILLVQLLINTYEKIVGRKIYSYNVLL